MSLHSLPCHHPLVHTGLGGTMFRPLHSCFALGAGSLAAEHWLLTSPIERSFLMIFVCVCVCACVFFFSPEQRMASCPRDVRPCSSPNTMF